MYWSSAEKTCKKCEYPCETCYNDNPTKCKKCSYQPELRDLNSGRCTCKTKYYHDSTL